MKGVFEFLTMISLSKLFDILKTLCKSFFAHLYVEVVDGLRNVYFLFAATIALIVLFFSGFLLLHAALFLYLSWSLSEKLFLLALLSLIYMILPLIIFGCLQSRSRWLKASGARKFIDDTTSKS